MGRRKKKGGYRKTKRVRAALAAKRETIIDAAAELIETTGSAPVTEVALRAGVALGTIYGHFADARELLAAVIARRLQTDLKAMERAAGAATKRAAAAAATFAVYVHHNRHCRGLASITANTAYRTGITHAFEERIAQLRNANAAVTAAAIYGMINAALGLREPPVNVDGMLVEWALRMTGINSRESGGFAAAGLTLADVMG